ncbi:MAG TPA: MMPL family transporter [Solirubrobacteraceae bacterium]|nr:MMPL family transporter [Solirubrobacteraceae bacterium]
MRVSERLERLVAAATRRPWLTLAVVVALALAGGALALGLQPSTGSDTFVSRSSANYRITADDQRHFGGDPVIVLIHQKLPDLVFTSELATVTQLEACLAGETVVANGKLYSFTPAAAGTQPPYGGWSSPCGQLMRMRAVQVVYGPGTFLNRAVAAVNTAMLQIEHQDQAQIESVQRAAYQLALAQHMSRKQAYQEAVSAGELKAEQLTNQMDQMALQSGVRGLPQIDNTTFISQVVFDPTRGVYQPKARLAYLFPNRDSALIQVRLRASLSAAEQARAIRLIRAAVRMPMFALSYGGTYTVSGAPVVLNDLASQLTRSIAWLLLGALVVMAVVLLLVFRRRLRLLPLVVALLAAGITFGLSALLGVTLTMASIAVLPVLIGLAVDYAVQFQSRVAEARSLAGDGSPAREAVAQAARRGAPTLLVAALATAVGFLVLLLSPVPMVRGFAALLVLGIAVALACALTAGSAALVLADRDGGAIGAALRGARELLSAGGARLGRALARTGRPGAAPARLRGRGPRGVLAAALRSPWRVLAVGALLAVLGWAADTQTAVQSDVTKLVPSGMPALRDLRTLERVTGVSGEIDVVVHGRDVATPQTIAWMIRYEQTLFKHYGYVEERGCADSTLCPALSLPDLFATGGQPQAAAAGLTTASINGLLAAVPAYFRQAVITPDRQEATLAFGIRLMPLARQEHVIDYMRSQLHPPPGVSAGLAGLPVLAAQANDALSSSPRRLLTMLAGLIAVGLALLAVLRRPRRVLVPLVPIVLATGWSALILFAIGIPLNPMSATLGALVIAISTEFSVLLSERYGQERRAGLHPAAALERTYRSTGAAVLASGLTAIAGFGVLVVSNISMLRDFGFVTVIDLGVSLGGVLLVLPAVLAISERGVTLADPVRGARERLAALPRPRRRARVA